MTKRQRVGEPLQTRKIRGKHARRRLSAPMSIAPMGVEIIGAAIYGDQAEA